MRKVFVKRAKVRSWIAYLLLISVLILIVTGIFIISTQITEFASKMASETKDSEIEKIKYNYTISIVTTLTMLFFISQVLLRLYRYNILKSDFYLACADALILTEKFNLEQKDIFEKVLSVLLSEKINLTTPNTPTTFSFFQTKEKP